MARWTRIAYCGRWWVRPKHKSQVRVSALVGGRHVGMEPCSQWAEACAGSLGEMRSGPLGVASSCIWLGQVIGRLCREGVTEARWADRPMLGHEAGRSGLGRVIGTGESAEGTSVSAGRPVSTAKQSQVLRAWNRAEARYPQMEARAHGRGGDSGRQRLRARHKPGQCTLQRDIYIHS